MWFIEDPWPPVLFLGVLAVVFGLAWNATRRKRYLLFALGSVLLGFMTLVVEEMIITEAEQVEARVYALAEAVMQEDVDRVLSFLAADNLQAEIGSQLPNVEIEDDLRITALEVTHEPGTDTALSHFRANGRITWRNTYTYNSPTRWNLTWQRIDGVWRITQIERLHPIEGNVIGTWDAL